MTTLTLKISDKRQAKMLYEMLKSMSFVKHIDMEDDLDEAEIAILNERLEEYKRNPKSGVSLDALVKKVNKKYGF